MKSRLYLLLLYIFTLASCTSVKEMSRDELFLFNKQKFLENIDSFKSSYNLARSTKLENLEVDHTNKRIKFYFSREFASVPLRTINVELIYSSIKESFGVEFSEYYFEIYSMNYLIEELIPNFYRSDEYKCDKNRLPKTNLSSRVPVVSNLSKSYTVTNGLEKNNILLWHSHGWYYNTSEKRWEWQRPRLFQITEDLLPASFTIPYLIPMLENAGAKVFVPRERDIQSNEVIVDNDFHGDNLYVEKSETGYEWKTADTPGFSMEKKALSGNENPFKMGSSRFALSSYKETASVSWIPLIPDAGNYSVYVSYSATDNNISDAMYSVHHSGGVTKFLVNQKIGGNTWIYLGTFHFKKGRYNDQGVVLFNNSKDQNKVVSADAVRFGGGLGIVEREGKTSGRPKFMEGARYWLQFTGMPDSLVYNLNNNSDDYKDDYQSRSEYGNYLFGNPFGPNKKRNESGLGIPIDLSLAFHTDAGTTKSDTVIGTLMIYSIPGLDSLHFFPDSVSRLANRDLADIVQTQIVEDFRVKYDSVWTRRQLMNSMYSEAARPNFPSILLELLSHQNFIDMKFALDPRFRFDASRSIYKGILKFLSSQYNYEYVVQPLPVKNFSAELNTDGKVTLKWKPALDETEVTAIPEYYIVYTRIDDNGFDNGIVVDSTAVVIENLEKGRFYSFKVSAINKGGESFPSEILSVYWVDENAPVSLVVNGFYRVAPPASVETKLFSGFTDFVDEGVPYIYDFGYTGSQYNFNPDSQWESDDKPGHGASNSNYETSIIAGNTFDFPIVHGKSIVKNGLSYSSASSESVTDGSIDLKDYVFVDIIFGEQKKTSSPKYNDQIEFETFPAELQKKLRNYLNSGGKLFVSGSYIATDIYSADDDSSSIKFANNMLKFYLRSGHAVKTGKVFSINSEFLPKDFTFEFNTSFNDSIYKAEAPDAIAGINGGEILLRYSENNFSAAVGYNEKYGVVSFGFPFETISCENNRSELMGAVLNYLKVK